MMNSMSLSLAHAEDLKEQIEGAIEHCGEKDFYDVKLVKQQAGSYRVYASRLEAVSMTESRDKKIIQLKRVS